MCIAHLKEIRDKMKSLKCVRKPHPHTATHVFSKLSFLPIMVVYSLYFTVLRDRIMLYHQEKSHICASARSRLREDLIRLFLVLISGIPHWQKRCASPLSLCVKISHQQVLALGTRSDVKCRRPFWKQCFGGTYCGKQKLVQQHCFKFIHAFLSPVMC